MNAPIVIPSRFESLADNAKLKAQPTLVKVDDDLKAFIYLANKARTQGGGVLAFILGPTGTGKSTAAFAASVYLGDTYTSLVRVPSLIDLREVIAWLTKNLPASGQKVIPVLFDGREVTDDQVGLKQFLTGLNQLLRSRSDVVFLWPTTDTDWHSEISTTAKKIGGTNLVPPDSDITVNGPAKSDWVTVLDRILLQLDSSLAEVGIDSALARETADTSMTIGDFLSQIGTLIAQRTTNLREIKSLPSITFVVSSGPEVSGEANRLRRAGSYVLKAEELIAYSTRSESGKWWQERQQFPEQNLSYIISLFTARLATLSASAVAYSCIHYGAPNLIAAATGTGMAGNTTNAGVTMRATDLYRLLIGERINELTSSRKGKTKDTTLQAFAAIQSLSAKQHKAINQAIIKSLANEIPAITFEESKFEVDGGDQNLYTDAILKMNDSNTYLEFHHLSDANCKASSMASYIMDKLRAYAIHYQLAPR